MAHSCQQCGETLSGTAIKGKTSNETPVGAGYFCSEDCCYDYCMQNEIYDYGTTEVNL
jgi:hypothetical protein